MKELDAVGDCAQRVVSVCVRESERKRVVERLFMQQGPKGQGKTDAAEKMTISAVL